MRNSASRLVSSLIHAIARNKLPKLPLRPIAFATLCLLLCASGTGVRAAGGSQPKATAITEGFKPGQKELADLTPLLVTATRFKTIARLDFEKALLMFCREKGLQKMWAIDKGFWTIEQSQWAWNLFFSSAVHVPGGSRGDSGIVGFYNPYSDAFLLTVWAPEKKTYALVDAEMLMGDWVRNDNEVLDPLPLWLREKVHRPVALGLAVAESILAFERVFESATREKWRSRLPILQNAGTLYDLNYPALSMMLNQHIINVGAISSPETRESSLSVCRDLAEQFIAQAVRGEIGPPLSKAGNTLPETATALKGLKPEWFKALKVCGVLTDPEGTLIFLTPHDQTNAALTLFFSGGPKNYLLQRVDIIDYQTFYNQLKFTRHTTRKGGQK